MQSHLADKAEIELVEVKDIPVFNKPADKKVPEKVTEIATKIETAEGVIIATPEYDHSIPAAYPISRDKVIEPDGRNIMTRRKL